MKKFLSVIIFIILFSSIILLFSKYYKNEKVDSVSSSFQWDLKYKGISGVRDFVFDEDENCYIAFPNKVQHINKNGKSIILFEDKKLNINSIVFAENKLFFISDCKLLSYDLNSKKIIELMNDIPNLGDYKDSKLLVMDSILFITIGAATNSGVVGEDNQWVKENPFHYDISPKTLTISAKGSSKQKSGAFVPFKVQNIAGQIIPAHYPGNASVVAYNIKNSESWLYAWGIRNVNGIDYNSEGKLFISIGGMEDRGARPVKGDVDYIYELKENIWYGWPDYSGGDPINSPRFKGNNNERIPFLLDKHPTTNPPAPFYQHKEINGLGSIVVDRTGSLGEKDSIYFYEIKDNIIYEINKTGVVKEKIKFKDDISVKTMKMHDGFLYIMDSDKGVIGSIAIKQNTVLSLNRELGYFLIGIIIIVIVSIMWKLKTNT